MNCSCASVVWEFPGISAPMPAAKHLVSYQAWDEAFDES